ncbi:MAG: putative transport system ATP-binding protein [Patescibacteria group bacterium]|nr:putative transport system ATP-binding protein [Patescibacteria group bacterium]
MQESDKKTIIELNNVAKHFSDKAGNFTILEHVNIHIKEGEKVAIVGPSGSGKSTLLSLFAGLDVPTQGEIVVDGVLLSKLNEQELADYRNKTIGIIFQSFELISPFTVKENIETPLLLSGVRNDGKVRDLIGRVGLSERSNNIPKTLSGGEKQRVAIARALVNNPKVILADEPTGSLDRETGKKVLELLLEEIGEEKKTLIIITHDLSIAEKMDRVFEVKNKTLHEKH